MLHAVLHVIGKICRHGHFAFYLPATDQRTFPAHIQPDFDRLCGHRNILTCSQLRAQPLHITGARRHEILRAGFADQPSIPQKRRRAEYVDVFQALAFVHPGQARGKINLPGFRRGVNARFGLRAVVLHQKRAGEHVALLARFRFQLLLHRRMNNHCQRAAGLVHQANPVKREIAHIRAQYHGMHHGIFIHHTLAADRLAVNNLRRRWQRFTAADRRIRVKPRHVCKHKFIQQDGFTRHALLRFPLFKGQCDYCL
ncbi:hypothetical protein HOS07_gp08 [Cronobacter phage ESSI-2]|uniref:Uncharacterized protein n=1 Tax=Cronobacter phage ESSI-2 TaxID=947842 RepID=F1BUK4_9CAUD|nr:hypothetical protein HOS07_gp08 [Cronobacter phage ESSI-2]ADX32380.1 hypothetical protein [Cronobacter phage ESSI-2]